MFDNITFENKNVITGVNESIIHVFIHNSSLFDCFLHTRVDRNIPTKIIILCKRWEIYLFYFMVFIDLNGLRNVFLPRVTPPPPPRWINKHVLVTKTKAADVLARARVLPRH